MDRLDKIFVKGNVLKAEELNEIVGKINELADASLIIGDAHRIAGILFGYLFIICGLFLFFLRLLPGFSRHGLIWSLLLMAFSLSLCLLLTKVKIQAAV